MRHGAALSWSRLQDHVVVTGGGDQLEVERPEPRTVTQRALSHRDLHPLDGEMEGQGVVTPLADDPRIGVRMLDLEPIIGRADKDELEAVVGRRP